MSGSGGEEQKSKVKQLVKIAQRLNLTAEASDRHTKTYAGKPCSTTASVVHHYIIFNCGKACASIKVGTRRLNIDHLIMGASSELLQIS